MTVPFRHVRGLDLAAFAVASVLLLALVPLLESAALRPAEVAGALALLLVTGYVFFSERYGRSLALLAIYLGTLDGYLKLSSTQENVVLVRDLIFYSIVAGALARLAIRRTRVETPPGTAVVGVLVAVVLTQVLNPQTESTGFGLQAVRQHIEWTPLFFFGYYVMRNTSALRTFLVLVLALAAVNGAVALYQSTLTPEAIASFGPGYANLYLSNDGAPRLFVGDDGVQRVRPSALGGDQGFGGAMGTLGLVAGLGVLLSTSSMRTRLLTAVLLSGAVTGIVTSAARTVILASVLAVAALFLLMATGKGRFRILVGMGTVAVGLLIASSVFSGAGALERYESITPDRVVETSVARSSPIKLVPEYARDYPFGAGLGSVGPAGSRSQRVVDRRLNAESQFTFLVIELGITGAVLAIGAIGMLLGLCLLRIRRVRSLEARFLLAALAAPLFAQVVTFTVGIGTASTPGSAYLWFAAGVLVYWLRRDAPASSVALPR